MPCWLVLSYVELHGGLFLPCIPARLGIMIFLIFYFLFFVKSIFLFEDIYCFSIEVKYHPAGIVDGDAVNIRVHLKEMDINEINWMY